MGKKGTKLTDAEDKVINKKRSSKCEKKYKERQKESKEEPALADQFMTGRVLAAISPRPKNHSLPQPVKQSSIGIINHVVRCHLKGVKGLPPYMSWSTKEHF